MKGILPRNGKFVARPSLHGKKHWVGTFDTLEAAESAIVKWRERRGVEPEGNVTVNYLATVFERERFPHLSPSTQGNYRRAIKDFCGEFGHRDPRTIRRIEIQQWASRSPRDNLYSVRTMFQWGITMDIISEDPTRGVAARPVGKKHKPQILSPAQVSALADTAFECWDEPEAEVLAAFIRFAAASGMRPGEIAALKWECIDFAADEITVKTAFSEGGEKAPKNGEERRIALTPDARAALAGLPPEQRGRIFELPDGQLLVKATLHRYWDRVRIKAGMDGYRLYDLRHTCATTLLEMGLPSYVVAAQLGHKDGGRLVESTYGHPSHQDALAKIKKATGVASPEAKPHLRVAGEVANGGKIA